MTIRHVGVGKDLLVIDCSGIIGGVRRGLDVSSFRSIRIPDGLPDR